MDELSHPLPGSGGTDEPLEAELARHLPGLRAYLRLRMGPELRARESASDIVQSTCRELLQQGGDHVPRDGAGFRRWLYVAARRKLADRVEHHRAAKREAAREVADAAGEHLAALYQTLSTPSRTLMRREWLEAVEHAFDRLSEAHREVILLSRVAGLSHTEIARELGKTPEATRSLLHRALAELAEHLPPVAP